MQEGDIVTAEVRDVRDNGLYLYADGLTGFVNITHLSWEQKVLDPHRFAKKGDRLSVKVYAVTPEGFYASLKDLDPSGNPFANPLSFAEGAVHRGTVTKVTPFGVFVTLENLAVGRISPARLDRSLNVGEVVDVAIISFDEATTKLECQIHQPADASGPKC